MTEQIVEIYCIMSEDHVFSYKHTYFSICNDKITYIPNKIIRRLKYNKIRVKHQMYVDFYHTDENITVLNNKNIKKALYLDVGVYNYLKCCTLYIPTLPKLIRIDLEDNYKESMVFFCSNSQMFEYC